jgi:hypothetical protein
MNNDIKIQNNNNTNISNEMKMIKTQNDYKINNNSNNTMNSIINNNNNNSNSIITSSSVFIKGNGNSSRRKDEELLFDDPIDMIVTKTNVITNKSTRISPTKTINSDEIGGRIKKKRKSLFDNMNYQASNLYDDNNNNDNNVHGIDDNNITKSPLNFSDME